MKKNPMAVALGKLAKGKKKTLSKAERARRKERMAKAREKRWPKTCRKVAAPSQDSRSTAST